MEPEVKANQIWRHHNGIEYFVSSVSNLANPREDHPPDVVYFTLVLDQGMKVPDFNNVWTRPLSDWHRSFTYVGRF